MVGLQLEWTAHLGAPIALGGRMTKQTPPQNTCGTFSKCFYLLHLYPPSVPVVFVCSSAAQSVQRCVCALLPRPPPLYYTLQTDNTSDSPEPTNQQKQSSTTTDGRLAVQ